jgi:hypothetical protein
MRKSYRRDQRIPPDDGANPELDALLAQVDRRLDERFLADLDAVLARHDEAEEPSAA